MINISLFNCFSLSIPDPLAMPSLPTLRGENSEQAIELSSRLNGWLRGVGSSNWELAIRDILLSENAVDTSTAIQSPRDFIRPCKSQCHLQKEEENCAFFFLFLLASPLLSFDFDFRSRAFVQWNVVLDAIEMVHHVNDGAGKMRGNASCGHIDRRLSDSWMPGAQWKCGRLFVRREQWTSRFHRNRFEFRLPRPIVSGPFSSIGAFNHQTMRESRPFLHLFADLATCRPVEHNTELRMISFCIHSPYNLTSALYAETETEKYASVVAVVRANSTYERFENLRHAKACFAEFGSIGKGCWSLALHRAGIQYFVIVSPFCLFFTSTASIAFIETGKNRGFFDRNQCNYGRLLNEFFGPSCTPGALDLAHGRTESLEKLCELCRTSSDVLNNELQASVSHESVPPLFHSNWQKLCLFCISKYSWFLPSYICIDSDIDESLTATSEGEFEVYFTLMIIHDWELLSLSENVYSLQSLTNVSHFILISIEIDDRQSFLRREWIAMLMKRTAFTATEAH